MELSVACLSTFVNRAIFQLVPVRYRPNAASGGRSVRRSQGGVAVDMSEEGGHDCLIT